MREPEHFIDVVAEFRKGQWQWYDGSKADKAKGIKGEVKTIPVPIKFTPLVSTFTVVGFNQRFQKGIYATEVLDHSDPLEVWFRGQDKLKVCEPGPWKEIKDDVKRDGGKYAEVVYAYTEGKAIVKFLMTGAAISGWIDISGADQQGIEISGAIEDTFTTSEGDQKTFYKPQFNLWTPDETHVKEAAMAKTKVQDYHRQYYEWKAYMKRKAEEDAVGAGVPETEMQETYVAQGGEEREEDVF